MNCLFDDSLHSYSCACVHCFAKSTDCIASLNNAILLGASISRGKFSDHLIQFFRRNVASSLSQDNFKSRACFYISLPINVVDDIVPRGERLNLTALINIPCFVFSSQLSSSLLQECLSFCPMLFLWYRNLKILCQALFFA